MHDLLDFQKYLRFFNAICKQVIPQFFFINILARVSLAPVNVNSPLNPPKGISCNGKHLPDWVVIGPGGWAVHRVKATPGQIKTSPENGALQGAVGP